MIIKLPHEDYYSSNTYKINFALMEVNNTCNHIAIPVNICIDLVKHNIFRHGVLNKSGYLIYCYLYDNPITCNELTQITGFSNKTIHTALERMSFIVDKLTGEIFQIVFEEGGKWFLNKTCNLDRMADFLGVDEIASKQKRRHEYDREIYRMRFPGKVKF